MSAIVGIKCDGCGARHMLPALHGNAGDVRRVLKSDGWHKVRGTYQSVSGERGYSRDICPTCWQGGAR